MHTCFLSSIKYQKEPEYEQVILKWWMYFANYYKIQIWNADSSFRKVLNEMIKVISAL